MVMEDNVKYNSDKAKTIFALKHIISYTYRLKRMNISVHFICKCSNILSVEILRVFAGFRASCIIYCYLGTNLRLSESVECHPWWCSANSIHVCV